MEQWGWVVHPPIIDRPERGAWLVLPALTRPIGLADCIFHPPRLTTSVSD
jgi:hypothetical protein